MMAACTFPGLAGGTVFTGNGSGAGRSRRSCGRRRSGYCRGGGRRTRACRTRALVYASVVAAGAFSSLSGGPILASYRCPGRCSIRIGRDRAGHSQGQGCATQNKA